MVHTSITFINSRRYKHIKSIIKLTCLVLVSGTPNKPTEKASKKLSLAEYTRRNKERKKREEEEKAKLEAERQKQQESRLSNDAVTAVLRFAY